MGHVDHIAEAKQKIEDDLLFRIVDGDNAFVVAVDRAGKKRFDHCVELVKMWASHRHRTGQQKYEFLMRLLALVTPEKLSGSKYRDPRTQKAYGYGKLLDDELGDILRREP